MRIGIDLGGTKIEGIAIDDAGRTLARRRVPTPRHDYAATLRAVAGVVAALEAETGRQGTVGVGMPGAVSPATDRVKNANLVWVNGRPFHHDLAATLGRPVRCVNDANCFAVSEARDGAAVGRRVVFGVILGTGCGGGLAIDGAVLVGGNAVAGEWGHNPLPWPDDLERPGPECYCGARGCLEVWISGTGFEADHRRATGRDWRAADIALAADAGDASAEAALARYEDRLARALATVVNLLDPEAIVLGGGLSNLDRLYRTVPPLIPRRVFGREAATPVLRAAHGDASGVRGAAWLWPAPGDPDRPPATGEGRPETGTPAPPPGSEPGHQTGR